MSLNEFKFTSETLVIYIMAIDNEKLKEKLVNQMLEHLNKKLAETKNGLYQKVFGTYKIGKYQGDLLIEFDKNNPAVGVYYGFKIQTDEKYIDPQKLDAIDQLFTPIIQSLEFELNKVIYRTDNYIDNYYWAFWLRCDDFDLDSAIRNMLLIRNYFEQKNSSQ